MFLRSFFCIAFALGALAAEAKPAGKQVCQALVNPKPFLRLEDRAPNLTAPTAHYISPNERFPEQTQPYFRTSPPGVYISVGTDRGFNNASLANSTHLLLIDYDACAVEFNVINTFLLAVARDRGDYVYLRLAAPVEEWMRRAESSLYGNNFAFRELQYHRPFSIESAWSWWHEWVRKDIYFSLFHQTPATVASATVGYPYFRDGNYLFYDRQWQKLHDMAVDGFIEARHQSLANFQTSEAAPDIERMLRAIRRAGLQVSVFDMSNAWTYTTVLTYENTAALLEYISKNTVPESVFLATQILSKEFFYTAYPFKTMPTRDAARGVVRSLNNPQIYQPKYPSAPPVALVYGGNLSSPAGVVVNVPNPATAVLAPSFPAPTPPAGSYGPAIGTVGTTRPAASTNNVIQSLPVVRPAPAATPPTNPSPAPNTTPRSAANPPRRDAVPMRATPSSATSATNGGGNFNYVNPLTSPSTTPNPLQ